MQGKMRAASQEKGDTLNVLAHIVLGNSSKWGQNILILAVIRATGLCRLLAKPLVDTAVLVFRKELCFSF